MMNKYRIRETGEVVSEAQFRSLHQGTSFPSTLTEELVNDFGADVVLQGQLPEATQYQIVQPNGAEQIDGKWYTKYLVVDMDDDQKAAIDQQNVINARLQRNKLLADSDWTQVADVPLTHKCKMDFATYRQALREVDINDPAWPVAPEKVWQS